MRVSIFQLNRVQVALESRPVEAWTCPPSGQSCGGVDSIRNSIGIEQSTVLYVPAFNPLMPESDDATRLHVKQRSVTIIIIRLRRNSHTWPQCQRIRGSPNLFIMEFGTEVPGDTGPRSR